MGAVGTDADGRRFRGDARIADVDVIAAGGQNGTGQVSECNIETAGVVEQGVISGGRISLARGICIQRLRP
jgi:hypothetical protein